ncbi:MAG: PAS domain-containing protein [Methylobacterium mesophilicum]|nr:PAS domain-containing protein [Methylobacterium mesophilicum]
MRQDCSIALFQYWNGLRGTRPAPRRVEVEPSDIRTLLSDTFILERDAGGEAVFRLAGTRLCAAHGHELKGLAFSSLWVERDRRLIAKLVDNTFEQQAVVVVDYRGVSEKGRQETFELMLLPLDGGAETPRCLGIANAVEKPFWLGADPIVAAHLDGVRVIDPDREAEQLRRPAVAAPTLVPDEIMLGAEPSAVRRVRHLLVLEGGREEND